MVTRIPLGSEPSKGCQVSPVGWLINRTFPPLNLRRVEALMGTMPGLLCTGPRGNQLSALSPPAFHPACQGWPEADFSMLPVLSVPSWPLFSLPVPAGFCGHPFCLLRLSLSQARDCAGTGYLHFIFY